MELEKQFGMVFEFKGGVLSIRQHGGAVLNMPGYVRDWQIIDDSSLELLENPRPRRTVILKIECQEQLTDIRERRGPPGPKAQKITIPKATERVFDLDECD